MPIITREEAKRCHICDWELFTKSPAYQAESDCLVYPDVIDDNLLAELAKDPNRLMWLVNNRLIDCDYMRARTMIRAVREAQAVVAPTEPPEAG